ncbi:MAG: hypothetical protein JWO06_2897 [Bacteroidota bacterium]|nr:hypothetical protein [Bacteroidota bacterium]
MKYLIIIGLCLFFNTGIKAQQSATAEQSRNLRPKEKPLLVLQPKAPNKKEKVINDVSTHSKKHDLKIVPQPVNGQGKGEVIKREPNAQLQPGLITLTR